MTLQTATLIVAAVRNSSLY